MFRFIIAFVARLEYWSHILRFHTTRIADKEDGCRGWLVCDSCEMVIWHRCWDRYGPPEELDIE